MVALFEREQVNNDRAVVEHDPTGLWYSLATVWTYTFITELSGDRLTHRAKLTHIVGRCNDKTLSYSGQFSNVQHLDVGSQRIGCDGGDSSCEVSGLNH